MSNKNLGADPRKEFCSNPNCLDSVFVETKIKNVGLTKVQVDELWSFVKKTKES